MKRVYDNWIEAFIENTEHTVSPKIFRKWAAISTIAATLERRTWVTTYGSALYPNLYVLMIARPGVGKSEMTWRVRSLWKQAELSVASKNLSRASLADELYEAQHAYIDPTNKIPIMEYNSLQIASDELSVLIPQYDGEFMAALTDLYDCHEYSEKKRSIKLSIKIDSPQLNMLSATQPSTLQTLLPDGAWEQGFMSRVIMIYSGELIKKSLFAQHETKQDKLIEDLKQVKALAGEFVWDAEAKIKLDEWHMSYGAPAPEHPKLSNYCQRRTTHVIKLSMVDSAAKGPSLRITTDNVQQAMDWLYEAEVEMPEVFKSMSYSGDSGLIEDVWHFVYEQYWADKETPIPYPRVVGFLSERADSYKVESILRVMVSAKILIPKPTPAGSAFIPGRKGN